MGMGLKPKKKTTKKKATKKRILPTVKRGGALPFLPMLGALGSLIGGAASVAKAVNDSKIARCQLEELQHHDRAMEQGRGLYLAPYKYGCGLYLGPYKYGQGGYCPLSPSPPSPPPSKEKARYWEYPGEKASKSPTCSSPTSSMPSKYKS
ncbi:hypothetical protein G5I_12225 [Acromyrmex echinatior]|uniref:Uncharacterized protein n=1 Tax=Acromyrmex echinatior TaxID=103372 RepID=F4X1R1_ACREC|nr:hypothetical protein G5I_12225 [Acromyrmex echinatior]